LKEIISLKLISYLNLSLKSAGLTGVSSEMGLDNRLFVCALPLLMYSKLNLIMFLGRAFTSPKITPPAPTTTTNTSTTTTPHPKRSRARFPIGPLRCCCSCWLLAVSCWLPTVTAAALVAVVLVFVVVFVVAGVVIVGVIVVGCCYSCCCFCGASRHAAGNRANGAVIAAAAFGSTSSHVTCNFKPSKDRRH